MNPPKSRSGLARTLLALFALLSTPCLASPVSAPARPPKLDRAPIEKPPLVLGLYEQRLLFIPNLSHFSLGGSLIRALPLTSKLSQSHASRGDSLLLKAIQIGSGDFWIFKTDGSIEHRLVRVEPHEKLGLPLPLAKALGQLNQTEVFLTGKGAILRGTLQEIEEATTLATLVRAYPKEVVNETVLSDTLLGQGQRLLSETIKTLGFASKIRVERIGAALWVRGSIEDPVQIPIFERTLRAKFPLFETEIDALADPAPTVHFRVFLLELKKTQMSRLGISWPGTLSPALQITSGGIQNLLQMDLALQQLEGSGNAKILSNPELVVRAPGEAELFAGGEIPIERQTRYASNVTWKNYGLTLKLKVSEQAGDRVRLEVFTEVSHLDRNTGSDHIPGIQANRMRTQIDAQFGTPLFLSGLLQEGIHEEAQGLPFLRKIPVLGLLFGSEDFLKQRSELVAILYPHSTPPRVPAEKNTSSLPRGQLPAPRSWLSPEDELNLRQNQGYPWNALE